MKITVGADVIGVVSAYYLSEVGHQVVVVDRQRGGAALETSYANAGEISPGYVSPWAASGVPLIAMRWLVAEHALLIIRPNFVLAILSWIARMMVRKRSVKRYQTNKQRMRRLAEYSRQKMIERCGEVGTQYDHRTQGTLQLCRFPPTRNQSFEIIDQRCCVLPLTKRHNSVRQSTISCDIPRPMAAAAPASGDRQHATSQLRWKTLLLPQANLDEGRSSCSDEAERGGKNSRARCKSREIDQTARQYWK